MANTNNTRIGRPKQPPINERFWSLVPEGDGCRGWTGTMGAQGYGVISTVISGKTKQYRAHRVAYALANGIGIDDIPAGMVVMHSCDNPPCCNPKHLSLGTHTDNAADRHRKGRDAKGDTSAGYLYPGLRSGERNGRAKLTEDNVRAIRRRYAGGGISQRALGEEYGVCQVVVSDIIRQKLWPREVDEL